MRLSLLKLVAVLSVTCLVISSVGSAATLAPKQSKSPLLYSRQALNLPSIFVRSLLPGVSPTRRQLARTVRRLRRHGLSNSLYPDESAHVSPPIARQWIRVAYVGLWIAPWRERNTIREPGAVDRMHRYATPWQRTLALVGAWLINRGSRVSRGLGIGLHSAFNLIGLPLGSSLVQNRTVEDDRDAVAFVAKAMGIERAFTESSERLSQTSLPMASARQPDHVVRPLSLYELLRRLYPYPTALWKRAGLEKEFIRLFPREMDFWRSSKSIVDIFRILKHSQAAQSAPAADDAASANKSVDSWDGYLEKNQMNFPRLRSAFSAETIHALLTDPVLRPVFLIQLPGDAVGPWVDVDTKPLDRIQPRINLDDYTVFLAGSPAVANMLVRKGLRIVVGVTDRYSDETMAPFIKVANARQCYFPLGDGSWLGVKGIGQLVFDKRPAAYAAHPSRYEGLAGLQEADNSARYYPLLGDTSHVFTQTLGYRSLFKIPDGSGGWIQTGSIRPLNSKILIHPVLIFSRTLSPHRMTKFSQLLASDAGLSGLTRRVSRALMSENLIETPLTAAELILKMAGRLGEAEAIKQNHFLYKITIHEQDFTLAGEETDNEELVPQRIYLSLIRNGTMTTNRDDGDIADTGLETVGIRAKLRGLIKLIIATGDAKEMSVVVPDPLAVVRTFYTSYFHRLDDHFLAALIRRPTDKRFSSALEAGWRGLRLNVFHPMSGGRIVRDPAQLRDIRDRIQRSAIAEWRRREALRLNSTPLPLRTAA